MGRVSDAPDLLQLDLQPREEGAGIEVHSCPDALGLALAGGGPDFHGRGLRRFLLRGLEKVNGEWLLWGTTHDLNKLWRFMKQRKLQPAMATA